MKNIPINILKSTLIIVFCTFIFIAISKSSSDEVVKIKYTGDRDLFVKQLEDEGVIKNSFSKLFIELVLALKPNIENGEFVFNKGMGAVSTAVTLDDPEYKYVSVIEGLRKAEIAEIVGTKLDWEKEKIIELSDVQPLCPYKGQEGFLASGVYLIHVDEDAKIVEQKMQETFDEVLKELNINEEDISVPKIITIASLIQREAGGKSDMRLISGIIQNRLKIDMPLQIDATLQYIKGNEEQWWPVPKSDDKKIQSPYNTYQNSGLPPTPIATPGKEAIKAALNPLKTNCLYYLHDSRRNIHCATTYEQHKKNIRYYLK